MKKRLTSVKSAVRYFFKEFKLIRWCRPKEWIQSSGIVIFIGTIMALILFGFDYISAVGVSALSGIVPHLKIRTMLQITIFIISLILALLCFLQSNRGQSALSGLTNTGSSLFRIAKDAGADKTVTRIISVLIFLLFILTMAEGSM